MATFGTRPSAPGIFVGLVALAMTPPLAGHGPASSRHPNSDKIFRAESADEDLLFTNQGALVLPRRFNRQASGGYVVKFETDACGLPQLRANRGMAPRQSALPGDMDDEDDPFVEALTLVGRSLSAHPELAVINDAIDRSCGDVVPLEGEPGPEDLTSWTNPKFGPLKPVLQGTPVSFDSRMTNSAFPFGKSCCSPPTLT
jgi:hypothetical protein